MNMNRQLAQQEARRMHRENMLRTLLQRLEAAKASRNETLIEQLEQEKKELGL